MIICINWRHLLELSRKVVGISVLNIEEVGILYGECIHYQLLLQFNRRKNKKNSSLVN